MPKTTLYRKENDLRNGDIVSISISHNADQDDLTISAVDFRGHIVVYIARAIQLMAADAANDIYRFRRLISGESFVIYKNSTESEIRRLFNTFNEVTVLEFI